MCFAILVRRPAGAAVLIPHAAEELQPSGELVAGDAGIGLRLRQARGRFGPTSLFPCVPFRFILRKLKAFDVV